MRRLSTRAAGLLILILGIWGGLVPFVGSYFHFALGPNHSWTWTSGRFWLSVLPAIVAIIGGLMLLGAGPRPSGKLGALLALAAGIWFAIGPDVSLLWAANATGAAHGAKFIRVLEALTYHTLLGTVIAALGGYALPGLVTRRAAAEAEAEAEAARAPAGAAAATPLRERTVDERDREPLAAGDGYDERYEGHAGAPLVAESEPVAGEPEREPVAAEPERAPMAGVRERDLRSEPEPVSPRQDETASRTAVMDRPTAADTQAADARAADVPAADAPAADARAADVRAADAPAGQTPPTTGNATDADAGGGVTMRRRRGGLLSRLRG